MKCAKCRGSIFSAIDAERQGRAFYCRRPACVESRRWIPFDERPRYGPPYGALPEERAEVEAVELDVFLLKHGSAETRRRIVARLPQVPLEAYGTREQRERILRSGEVRG